jgi:dTDP-4-amino-4,6-dideoxygalactose transaminase
MRFLLKYQNRNHEELVHDFEKAASSHLLNNPVVGVSSGTAALHLALATLNIGPGDLVVVPTFSYVASVNPVLYTGAKPVWIDSEETTWNLCPELLSQALKKIQCPIQTHQSNYCCAQLWSAGQHERNNENWQSCIVCR